MIDALKVSTICNSVRSVEYHLAKERKLLYGFCINYDVHIFSTFGGGKMKASNSRSAHQTQPGRNNRKRGEEILFAASLLVWTAETSFER